jgi:hypothetical protein
MSLNDKKEFKMTGLDYSPYAAVGEHKIPMPPCPTDKKEIFFIDQKEGDAFWDRSRVIKEYRDIWFNFLPNHTKLYQSATIYDQDDILISLNKEDSDYIIQIYEQEMRRRRNGVFMKNKNKIEWITGDHYNALLWCKGQRHDGLGDYFDYREFQAWFFYLINFCWSLTNVLGAFISKAKKTGITNMFWLYYLNRATMSKNRNYGYMNLEQNIAAKTFRDYFLYSYNNMVPALRPQFKNKSENDGTIIFGKSYNNSKKSRMIAYDSDDELNSSVFCVPTKEKAFDVAVMNDIAFDEPTKYTKSFGEIFRTNKEAVKIQSKFNGRAWAFNYTIGEDSQSFREARDVFMDSKKRTITQSSNGETKSGMLAWHIPGYVSWEGCFDKHGRCDEKRAMKENERERDKVKDNRRNLQTVIRQYANDEREAWSSSGAGSTFDNIRLGDLLADIEIDQRDAIDPPYREGKLEWENWKWEIGLRKLRKPGQFCPVKFVPLTDQEKENGEHGRYREYFDIPVQHRNACLKNGFDEYGCLLPPERFLYVGGGDPTGFAEGSEVTQGSKNASYTFRMPDEHADRAAKKIITKVFYTELYHRAELPQESYEDILKEIIYTGKLVIIEANASYVATRLMQEGLGHYMLVKGPDGEICRWKPWMGLAGDPEKKYSLIKITSNSSANKDVLETLVRCWKSFIERPAEGEKDYGRTFKSERAIKQLMDFNPLDTKTSDLVMGGGYALWCYDLYTDMLLNTEDDYSPDNFGAALLALSRED